MSSSGTPKPACEAAQQGGQEQHARLLGTVPPHPSPTWPAPQRSSHCPSRSSLELLAASSLPRPASCTQCRAGARLSCSGLGKAAQGRAGRNRSCNTCCADQAGSKGQTFSSRLLLAQQQLAAWERCCPGASCARALSRVSLLVSPPTSRFEAAAASSLARAFSSTPAARTRCLC